MSNALNVTNGVIIGVLVQGCNIALQLLQLLQGLIPIMKGTIKDSSRITKIEVEVVLEEGRPE